MIGENENFINRPEPVIQVLKGEHGKIVDSFSYNPEFIAKVKTILGHRRA